VGQLPLKETDPTHWFGRDRAATAHRPRRNRRNHGAHLIPLSTVLNFVGDRVSTGAETKPEIVRAPHRQRQRRSPAFGSRFCASRLSRSPVYASRLDAFQPLPGLGADAHAQEFRFFRLPALPDQSQHLCVRSIRDESVFHRRSTFGASALRHRFSPKTEINPVRRAACGQSNVGSLWLRLQNNGENGPSGTLLRGCQK
jgi:hypothetical protein